jgi:hydroxypyruvate reductase
MALSTPLSDQLQTLFAVAIAAVDPRSLISRIVCKEREELLITLPGEQILRYRFPLRSRILLIGAGKGAGVLAQGLALICAEHEIQGVVVVPAGQPLDIPHVTVVYGEHPVPGEGSVRGAEAIFALLAQKQPDDLICFCLTGGASSLLVSPVEGVSLADKVVVNQLLLACGADIHEVNSVRKHLSRIKGGLLARHAFPNHIVSFILSDVLNDDLSTIGSGPTVPDASTFANVWEILTRYALLEHLPSAVHSYLLAGCQSLRQETPKPRDPIFSHAYSVLVGSNRLALEAAAQTARTLGFVPHLLPTPLSGDTTKAARAFAHILRALLRSCHEPICVLAGGETTVRVTGHGKGGRNQEFALVVAEELQNENHWALLSAGTDGIDGPTDAAGAFVDGTSTKRAQQKGLEARRFLKENDSYAFFAALGDLCTPGPTGTNVTDIKIALLWPLSASTTSSS